MEQKNFIDYIDTIDSTRAKVDLLISLTGDKALIDYKRRGKEGVDFLLLEVSTTLEDATIGLMKYHNTYFNEYGKVLSSGGSV